MIQSSAKSSIILLVSLLGTMATGESSSPDTIKFSHKLHIEDVEVECLDCHTAAEENSGGGKSNHPEMDVCRNCHEDQMEEKECGMCHSNADNPSGAKAQLQHKNFSHKLHLAQEVECKVCHGDMTKHDPAKGETNLPDMKVCFGCHDDKKASRNCGDCHAKVSDVKPESHQLPGFAERTHGSDARFKRENCRECHQDRFCDQCHVGQKSFDVHPANFRYTHGFDARRRAKECRTCHEPNRFCAKCHEGK